MCNEIYVHYACGHDDIVASPCELAEGLPFYIKHACTKYTGPVSMSPQSLCGKGKYYCGKAAVDGEFLDGVHTTLERCQGTLTQIDEKLALLKQRAMQFTIAANQNNVPQDVRKRHPAYGVIGNNFSNLMQQRNQVDADRRQVTHIIKHAIAFFRQRRDLGAQQAGSGIQPALTLPPGTGSMPMELAPAGPVVNPAFGIPMAAPLVALTRQAIDISQGSQLPGQTISHLPPSDGSSIKVTHVRHDTGNLVADGQKATPTPTPQKALQPDASLAPTSSGVKATSTKRVIKQNSVASSSRRRRPVSPEKPSPAPAEDSSNVRRSDRVRTKKVTYAESQTSDISRGSSPDKYEESPTKSISEWSESPEPASRRTKKQQRKPQRSGRGGNGSSRSNNETLASKIVDWKRRTENKIDDSSGKLSSARGASGAGEQAAGQQQDAQKAPGSTHASSQLWRAPQSQHSQVMMQGAAPFMSARQGMFGYGSGARQAQYNYSMQASLGRPFPDNTHEAAVLGPNLFNSYLQQSWPDGDHRSQPTQAWSVQQNAQYPSQQQTTMAGHGMQPAMDFAQTQPLLNNQYLGGGDDFTIPPSDSSLPTSSMQQALAPNLSAIKATSTQQAGFTPGFSDYMGGYTPNLALGLQTPSDSRADSVTYPEANCFPDIDVETYFDYDGLRRSFGTATDLSAAKTLDVDLTATEPKKRAAPAFSPTPSAKRMRLSLPGQANASSVHECQLPYSGETDGTTATSSPAKISTQQLRTTDHSVPFEGTVEFVPPMPAPAPIMAPTAIHFPQAQSPTVAENLENAAELPSIVVDGVERQEGLDEVSEMQQTGVTTGDVEDGNTGSDIDRSAMGNWFVFGNE